MGNFTLFQAMETQTEEGCYALKAMQESLFLRFHRTKTPLFHLHKLVLLKSCKPFTENEENDPNTVGSALIMCPDNSCELVKLAIPDKKMRNKGYGSTLLQESLRYLKQHTQAFELGLLAVPMGYIYEPQGGIFKTLLDVIKYPISSYFDRKRLHRFYKKNGGRTINGAPTNDFFEFPIEREPNIVKEHNV